MLTSLPPSVDTGLWLAILVDASIKGAVVLAIAAAAAAAMRRAGASLRHLVWATAIVSVLCLPVLSMAVPTWPGLNMSLAALAWPARGDASGSGADSVSSATPIVDTGSPADVMSAPSVSAATSSLWEPLDGTGAAAGSATATPHALAFSAALPGPSQRHAAGTPVRSAVLMIWALGALAAFMPGVLGLVCRRRIARHARRPVDRSWDELLCGVSAEVRLRRPVTLLQGRLETVPMVWGWFRPVLLLPAGADSWCPVRRRLVLLHELVHAKRGDCVWQWLGRLACSIHWFNPLVWVAVHRLAREQELACDDVVLSAGYEPVDYAQHLVEITRSLQRPNFASGVGVAMGRRSTLETRVRAIVDVERSRKRLTPLAALLVVVVVGAVAVSLAGARVMAAAPSELAGAGVSTGEPPAVQWLPSESYRGGKQADPRLNRPVEFWGAGLSLEEVFAEIGRQTGAKLSFFPEDDENRRVRVHLFLNQEAPPALRSLMAQLSWVVGCPFFVAGDAGERTYFLMATSIGGGAAAALRAREAREHRKVADVQQAIQDKLSELEAALELSREDAIGRYGGSDDRMLLNLLDPARRGASLIAARRFLPWLETNRFTPEMDHCGIGISMMSLSEEEQAAYVAAFGVSGSEFGNPTVSGIGLVEASGEVILGNPIMRNDAGDVVPAGDYTASRYIVLDLRAGARLAPEEEVALGRALGEQISPAQETAYVERRTVELVAEKSAQPSKSPEDALSPGVADLLGETVLPLAAGGSYPVWRIEGEVARATGLHVVSDALLDATGTARTGGVGGVTALNSLESFCSREARDHMRSPEWEWGDAGAFLHFRTANQNVWRAAMLPEATLDWLAGQVGPFLPDPDVHPETLDFSLTADPEQWTRQLARLSDLQIQYGAEVLQGNPYDLEDAAGRAAWGAASQHAEAGLSLIRFLGGMDVGQWQLARAGNLRCPEDLTPDQGKLLEQVLVENTLQAAGPEGYAHIRIAVGEATADRYESVTIITTTTTSPDGTPGAMTKTGTSRTHTSSADGRVESSGPKAWHQATFTALTDAQNAEETPVFEKQSFILPTTLTVRVRLPE